MLAEKNRRINDAKDIAREQAGNKILDQEVAALQAKGTATVSTLEAGIEGRALTAQVGDLERQKITNVGSINRDFDITMGNFGNQQSNLQYDADNAYYAALNQINSVPQAYGQSEAAAWINQASNVGDSVSTWYKLGGRYGKKDGKGENKFYTVEA